MRGKRLPRPLFVRAAAVIILIGLFAAAPFYIMLITMFKRNHDLLNPANNPFIFNEPPTLAHLKLLVSGSLFPEFLLNSTLVGVAVVVITVVLSVLVVTALCESGCTVTSNLIGSEKRNVYKFDPQFAVESASFRRSTEALGTAMIGGNSAAVPFRSGFRACMRNELTHESVPILEGDDALILEARHRLTELDVVSDESLDPESDRARQNGKRCNRDLARTLTSATRQAREVDPLELLQNMLEFMGQPLRILVSRQWR